MLQAYVLLTPVPRAAALAAQSLLAALGSVQFIANIVFGRIVLKEKVCLATL